MDTFKRIRSAITELKKEKEDLKIKYEFLADELTRLVEANTKEIKAAADKSMAVAEGVAATREKIKKVEGSIPRVKGRMLDEITTLKKHSEDFKRALFELGERVHKAQDAAKLLAELKKP